MTAVIKPTIGKTAWRSQPDSRPSTEDLLRQRASLPADDPQRSQLRARAIEANLPMAYRLARRYAGRGELIADLKHVAALALVNAVDTYDPQCQDDFHGYAIACILGAISKHLRDTTWGMRVARSIQVLACEASQASGAIAELARRRSPTPAEYAFHLGTNVEEVQSAILTSHAHEFIDLLGGPHPRCVGADDYQALIPLLDCLAPRERRLIAMRYYTLMSQSRIAVEIGASPRQLSRLHKQSLGDLRAAISGADRGATS
ncbi:MAG TPA: sigma-70 family RNA polymerase sigma factor [Candidatus Limnocylindrales bacterium]|nr:sigma-70 family RNA polymerase sigma factor [Candidatus Limnocylindrales bacterium]